MSAAKEPQLLVLAGRGGDRLGSLLLGNGPRVAAADGATDELAQQRPLVPEVRVHRLLGDTGSLGNPGDARTLVASLVEQLRGSGEHSLPRLLGLLAPPLRAVRPPFNKALLHLKETACRIRKRPSAG
jgi:hypothetical protein